MEPFIMNISYTYKILFLLAIICSQAFHKIQLCSVLENCELKKISQYNTPQLL